MAKKRIKRPRDLAKVFKKAPTKVPFDDLWGQVI